MGTATNNGIPQISVQELKQRLDAGEDIMVLDVRETYECQIASIGGTLIPMNQVPDSLRRSIATAKSSSTVPIRRPQPAHR